MSIITSWKNIDWLQKGLLAILFLLYNNSNATDILSNLRGDSINHTIYLIGDAGERDNILSNFSKVNQHYLTESKSTIVFLGDNIYPAGMPDKKAKGRQEAERIISDQINLLNDNNLKGYFIPGNHDWANGTQTGLKHVLNQEKFIKKYTEQKKIFLPGMGCPGPAVVHINKEIVLIAIDTQWWLHGFEKSPNTPGECDFDTPDKVIDALTNMLSDYNDKQVIVLGHHPIYSDGNHGGNFTFKDHLFPLTNLNKSLYLPLPFIGSIYPLYRKKLGNIQDLPHPEYQYLIKSLNGVFSKYEGIIYAAGHEHSLQYHFNNNNHYIVSGTGSKTAYVSKKGGAVFSASEKGYFKLISLKNGGFWIEAVAISPLGEEKTLFKRKIKRKVINKITDNLVISEKAADLDTVVEVAAGPNYAASDFKKLLFGSHYRNAWTTEIKVPVIDLQNTYGGLIPIQKGGGMQTKSLRLSAGTGHQYVFRSIQKDPSSILPEEFRQTFADDILQDQISSAHPYGAFVIPDLAEASKIFYSIPQLRVVPDDNALKQYRSDFANLLVLFEQRPDDNLSDIENYGFTSNAIGTTNLISKI